MNEDAPAPVVSGNMATTNAGGVFVGGGSFRLREGAIRKNTAQGGNGGGVYLNGTGAVFAMLGGVISGNNAAKELTGEGGGVWNNNSKFYMMDGKIFGDNAKGSLQNIAANQYKALRGTVALGVYGTPETLTDWTPGTTPSNSDATIYVVNGADESANYLESMDEDDDDGAENAGV